MREMRRKNQALPAAECVRLLEEGTSGVLAVLGDDMYPYAVPLSYVYREGKIYFHCAPVGHKLDAIARHDKVSFCVIGQDEILPEKFTTCFRSVIVFGRARLLREEGEIRAVLEALGGKYSPGVPGLQREIDSSIHRVGIIELHIEHMTGKEAIELTRQRTQQPSPGAQ